jgi:hypothetical protein
MTGLIVQLFREQRAAEDRVMFDSYANGGRGINGKPVTDQTMRTYMAGRRNEFTKDDPLYDEWSNRLTQLDFKIGESKVQLAYQQGHVGAGAVASFYRHQLSTIPQNSEFYRTVAGRAAQWAKAGMSAARGRAHASLTKALDGKMQGVAKTWANYGQLEAFLTDAAKRAGLIAGNQTLTDADATDLEAFLKAGVAGPKGTTITFSDWQHAAISAYKAFDTQIALNKQLNRGTKTLTSQKQKFLDRNLVRINTIDDRAKYEVARDTFQQAVSESQGDPRVILDAAHTLADTLSMIQATAAKSADSDPEFIGGLQNEIEALRTGKASGASVADLQSTYGEGAPTSDIDSTAESIRKHTADLQDLLTGKSFYGQVDPGGELAVYKYAPGAEYDPFGRNGLDESFQPSIINNEGHLTPVMLKGQEIKAVGLVAPDGTAVTSVNNIPVENLTAGQIAELIKAGYATTDDQPVIGYIFHQGGHTTFGVKQSDGSLAYTSVNPFDLSFDDKGNPQVLGSSEVHGQGRAVPIVPMTDLTADNSDPYLADESITPKDLRALAATSDAATAAQLAGMADKKEKGAQAENDVQRRRQHPAAGPTALTTIGSGIRDAVNTLQTTIRDATVLPDVKTAAPPSLPSLGAPVFSVPTSPSPAPGPAPSPTMAPAPTPTMTPTAPSPGKLIDDVTSVSPSSLAASGGTVGAASASLIEKYTKPKTTTGGSIRQKPL